MAATRPRPKLRRHTSLVSKGAVEVDMVANLGKVLSGDWKLVEADIRAVVEAARSHGAITKVIFECGLLPNDEVKIRLCQVSEAAGAAFVKTSTGYGFMKQADGTLAVTGATEHDVKLMRATCSPAVQVKAAGGMRSYADALRFVELGATRFGTSSTKIIAAGERGEHAKSRPAIEVEEYSPQRTRSTHREERQTTNRQTRMIFHFAISSSSVPSVSSAVETALIRT